MPATPRNGSACWRCGPVSPTNRPPCSVETAIAVGWRWPLVDAPPGGAARHAAAASQRRRQQQRRCSPARARDRHRPSFALSSPSAGAALSNAGLTPSNDSGRPTRPSSLPCLVWMMPSACVCASATTWSNVLIGPFGMPWRVEQPRPFRARLRRKNVGQDRDQLLAVDDAVFVAVKARVLGEAGAVEHGGQAAEQIVVAGRHHHVPVRGGKRLIRHDHIDPGAVPRRQFAVREIPGEIDAHPRQPGLVERGIDDPALAGAAAFLQRRQDADHRPHPGPHVDDRGRHPDRRAAVLAQEAHQPAIGLHHRVVAGLVAQRPRRAERAEIAEHKARFRRNEIGPAEPVAVERAEFEIVQHDIGPLENQRPEPRRVRRIGEIDRNAALGAIDRVKTRRRPLQETAAPTPAPRPRSWGSRP